MNENHVLGYICLRFSFVFFSQSLCLPPFPNAFWSTQSAQDVIMVWPVAIAQNISFIGFQERIEFLCLGLFLGSGRTFRAFHIYYLFCYLIVLSTIPFLGLHNLIACIA